MNDPEEIAKLAIGVEYMGHDDQGYGGLQHTEEYGLGSSTPPQGSPSHQRIMGGAPAWGNGNGVLGGAPTIGLPSQGSPPRGQGSSGSALPRRRWASGRPGAARQVPTGILRGPVWQERRPRPKSEEVGGR